MAPWFEVGYRVAPPRSGPSAAGPDRAVWPAVVPGSLARRASRGAQELAWPTAPAALTGSAASCTSTRQQTARNGVAAQGVPRGGARASSASRMKSQPRAR